MKPDRARLAEDELNRASNPQSWTEFTVTFFVYAGSMDCALALAAELRSRGWSSEALSVEDIEPLVVRGYRRLERDHGIESLEAFESEMEMIAERHGAEYDGSGVSIQQPDG